MRRVNVLVIHREAFPFATPWLERLAMSRAEFSVLDFDDALFAEPTHGRDWRRRFRNPAKFSDVVRAADLVTVASPVLLEWASKLNPHVELALTLPPSRRQVNWSEDGPVPVVWIGSDSTVDQLLTRLEPIRDAVAHLSSEVRILSGDQTLSRVWPSNVSAARWSEAGEDALLSVPGVGVMPLTSDTWGKGKGAYKALLYLSAGWPVVMSPVGMNIWVLNASQAGRLADSEDSWREAVSLLLDNPVLCSELGDRGRKWLEMARHKYDLANIILTGVKNASR
ncbi:glycosyltransferase family 4 protein [Cryobacterium sp. M91]|uniref:glycosyltransferase n=1 Tax=Cryobacterium sp. M91 TaxID=2048294 RepID=UPI0011B0BF73|nr:glycosyltransferase family 4 protein [Cryobacterium sp. M91]